MDKICDNSPKARKALEKYNKILDEKKKQGMNVLEVDLENMDPGVRLHGIWAKHPLTGKQVPVYVASYVLADYGNGIVMGVPFHDERDQAFALENDLDMICVVDEESQTMVNSTEDLNGVTVEKAAQKVVELLGENGKFTTEYRLRDWLVSRQRYWGCPIPIVNCEKCGPQVVPTRTLPIVLPEIDPSESNDLLKHGTPLENFVDFVNSKCPKCEGYAKQETDTLDTFIDSSWYFLRFLDSINC